MLRNQQKFKILLENLQQHYIHRNQQLFHQQHNVLYNKDANLFRQVKIMGKLFGNRVSGSKKKWFPVADTSNSTAQSAIFRQTQFGKTPNSGGKNATRRMTVLNKLFMKHVTDLMATGEISETILGMGLQVSRVKLSQDFAYVNVYWVSTGETGKDTQLEHELQRCSGLLRHELSQLDLMGVVPRVKFVKDKLFANFSQVEGLLKNMDFSAEDSKEDLEYIEKYVTDTIKEEFYSSKIITPPAPTALNPKLETNTDKLCTHHVNLPEMRHDVLGLDQKGIMLKILTKMRKSKQAWEQHHQQIASPIQDTPLSLASATFEQISKNNEKLAKAAANSEKFEAFLAKRRERRNTPERKKFRVADHQIDSNESGDHHDFSEFMSARQLQLYEAEDFLSEDIDDKKHS